MVSTIAENKELNDFYFHGMHQGWAVGAQGSIYKTNNGGESWQYYASVTSKELHAVSFNGKTTGWAVGEAGTVLKTTDGGGSWELVKLNARESFYAVVAPTKQICLVAGSSGSLYKTLDGGQTWSKIGLGSFHDLKTLFFINADTGFVAGTGGTLRRTFDGGNSWEVVLTGTRYEINKIYFTDRQHGWAVGGGGLILHTTDGGVTWKHLPSNTQCTLRAISFAAGRGLIVGSWGTVLKSDDGLNWIPIHNRRDHGLLATYLSDATSGLVLGYGGALFRYDDFMISVPSEEVYTGSKIKLHIQKPLRLEFPSGNEFVVQLSADPLDFSAPIEIARISAQQSGYFDCEIPAELAPLTDYTIRVSSTKPKAVSSCYSIKFKSNKTDSVPAAAASYKKKI